MLKMAVTVELPYQLLTVYLWASFMRENFKPLPNTSRRYVCFLLYAAETKPH